MRGSTTNYVSRHPTSYYMLPSLFFIYQALEVGLMDVIEFKYVNKNVFYEHNFPDILGIQGEKIMKQGSWSAFISGIKCCPPLLIPCIAKIAIFAIKKAPLTSRLYKIHACLATLLFVGDIITLSTFNASKHNIYRNHSVFYTIHIGFEVISIFTCLFC